MLIHKLNMRKTGDNRKKDLINEKDNQYNEEIKEIRKE